MFQINPDKHVLFDASVIVAAFNKLDPNHQKALGYIQTMPRDRIVLLPAHGLFEFMAAISRGREVLKTPYLSFEKDKLRIPFDNIHITQQLANEARDQELLTTFKTLKGGDLIYACIAKIYSLPLVTFDHGFRPYKSKIEVEILE